MPRRSSISRRRFLGASSAGVAAVLLGTGWWSPNASAAPRLGGYPFTLGVASGDPAPDGVVLWTRLAVDPFAPDGKGGMPVHMKFCNFQRGYSRISPRTNSSTTSASCHTFHSRTPRSAPVRASWSRTMCQTASRPDGLTTTPGTKACPRQCAGN